MFISKNRNSAAYVDTIFPVTTACKKDRDPSTVNGTIGSFYTEEGVIAVYKSVFDSFRSLSDQTIASYAASSFGNGDYNEAIASFILEGKVTKYRTIPAPGGTGGLNTASGIGAGKAGLAPVTSEPNRAVTASRGGFGNTSARRSTSGSYGG